MSGRRRGEVPLKLLWLEQRLAAWRATRAKGERIPLRLWKLAADLATTYGLAQTARVLKLDYYSLQKRMEPHAGCHGTPREKETPAAAGFIELHSLSPGPASECLIECENGSGGRLRVHWKGASAPDLAGLGRAFWGSN